VFGAIKRAGKEGLIYGIGQGLQGAVAFLLVPIYIRSLTQSEFGKLGLIVPVGAVASIIISMGLNSAIFRSYFDYEDVKNRRLVVNTTLILLALTSLTTVLIGVPTIPFLCQALFGEVESTVLVWLLVVKGMAGSFASVPLAIYRARGQALKYVWITLATVLLKASVIIYLVVIEGWGMMGLIGGDTATAVIATIVMLWTIRKDMALEFSRNEARKLLAFGLPLVPADMASMVFARADLFFLNRYTNLSTVGQYNAALIIINAMRMLIKTPFMLIWTPMILSVEKKEFAKEFYARVVIYVLTVSGLLALAISTFSSEIIRVIAGSGYELASQVLPILCLAQVFYLVQISFSVGITLKRKTQFIPLILFTVAVVTMILNFILVPVWGMIGAGIAGLLSAMVFAVLTYTVSQRIYSIPQKWRRITTIVICYSVTYIFVKAFNTFVLDQCPEWMRIALTSVVTIVLSLFSVWYSLSKDEKDKVRRKLAIWVAKAGIQDVKT